MCTLTSKSDKNSDNDVRDIAARKTDANDTAVRKPSQKLTFVMKIE